MRFMFCPIKDLFFFSGSSSMDFGASHCTRQRRRQEHTVTANTTYRDGTNAVCFRGGARRLCFVYSRPGTREVV